jgi:hypothetical protein
MPISASRQAKGRSRSATKSWTRFTARQMPFGPSLFVTEEKYLSPSSFRVGRWNS